MSEEFNMSMRKFLKQVGVTSQRAIEAALRETDGSGKSYAIRAVISIEELGLEHVVEGSIQAKD